MANVPTLSRWSSRLFATDPAEFMRRGRALAAGAGSPAWAFYLPTARACLGERVTVVASREHAEAVLQGPSVFLDGEVLAPLLGRTSSLLDLPTAVRRPRETPLIRNHAASAIEATIIGESGRSPFDLVPALERAAALLALLRCADTPALVCPPLRALSPRWRMLAKARAAFLAAAEVPSTEAEGDAAVTLLVGAVDAPVAVACAAVYGEAVAVDAGAAGLPFGLGPHACSGARLGRMFAEEAVAAFQRLGVRVLPQRVRYVRRRLVVAPERLMCERA